jgi:hypothetical protein
MTRFAPREPGMVGIHQYDLQRGREVAKGRTWGQLVMVVRGSVN